MNKVKAVLKSRIIAQQYKDIYLNDKQQLEQESIEAKKSLVNMVDQLPQEEVIYLRLNL